MLRWKGMSFVLTLLLSHVDYKYSQKGHGGWSLASLSLWVKWVGDHQFWIYEHYQTLDHFSTQFNPQWSVMRLSDTACREIKINRLTSHNSAMASIKSIYFAAWWNEKVLYFRGLSELKGKSNFWSTQADTDTNTWAESLTSKPLKTSRDSASNHSPGVCGHQELLGEKGTREFGTTYTGKWTSSLNKWGRKTHFQLIFLGHVQLALYVGYL